jgi:hypothetical protein
MVFLNITTAIVIALTITAVQAIIVAGISFRVAAIIA